ncbi:uncharacterized protein UTRI_06383 [Ustilago trichophora]|uniref:LIM zinc-binding domain-containing protein n=1 Tax=Ustilago trichophora TaxID=86804 RepID=A0A5C3EIN3_9BASI|nr:uncharacterized protein UTRI_06383 [Ustilago trichophora]
MSSPAIAALGSISPTRLGFCQRCGDPISGKIRCSRCGGTSKEPRIRSTQVLCSSIKKSDPWAHRYVHTNDQFPETTDIDDEYLHNQPPPLSPKRASYDPALGFGMPSRISRDLRTSASIKTDLAGSGGLELNLGTSPNDRLSPAPRTVEKEERRLSQDYSAPVVKGSDGVLSKVCGSLVEPSATRNRWACADCATVFARDSTLYAAPASLQSHDGAYYCRDCYAKRYSLGDCNACGRDVLGSTKEDGKYVKASAGIWHGRCWKCTSCSKGSKEGVEILVGMDGNPTCEGCFDRPKRRAAQAESPLPGAKEDLGLPDVRRLTRLGGARNGPMGATIAELTKKLGQQSVTTTSPRIPFSTSRSGSNTSLPKSSSSNGSLDTKRSSQNYAFPNHIPTSPGKVAMARSGSLMGSPPKPRPLTAQFRDGLNLAAFQPAFSTAADGEDERVYRRDSRSRSVSPVKRTEWKSAKQTASDSQSGREKDATSPSLCLATDTMAQSKVPGSPSLPPSITDASNTNRLDLPIHSGGEPGRRRTSSGFPRPLNSPFSKTADPTEPIQGEKLASSLEKDLPNDNHVSLEPASGTVRCAVCHLLPFERVSANADEVVMVTLSDHVHLHAECFTCSVCGERIDGTRTFVRLSGDAMAAAYAHPHCSPTVRLTVVQAKGEGKEGEGRSFRSSLDPASALVTGKGDGGGRSHATHQRELKPSPTPSPATSMRDRGATARASILPASAVVDAAGMVKSTTSQYTTPSATQQPSGAIRRFQPTAGAAPPTRSTILSAPTATVPITRNPAAGIFSRLHALSSASGNSALTTTTSSTSSTRFGGMQNCAFCGEKLSSLESVLGPRGTQWHKNCLICRAPPPPTPKGAFVSYRKETPKWCGKKLDSGAKVNGQGEVRCRDCYDRESGAFRIKT